MRWWLVLIVAASCAKSLEEIGEFKCPANGFCPVGFSCSGGMCRAAAVDGPCQYSTLVLPHGDPCTIADASARCLLFDAQETKGICAKPCASGSCDAAHVCAKDPLTNEMYCLLDGSAPCPAGTSPHPTTDANGTMVSVCTPTPPAEGEDCASSFACGLSDANLVCAYGICAQTVDDQGACPSVNGVVGHAVYETVEGYLLHGCFPPCVDQSQCAIGETCTSSNVCIRRGSRGVGVGCDTSLECESNYCLAEQSFKVQWHVCSERCLTSACPAGFACSLFPDDPSLDSCYLAGTDLHDSGIGN